MFSLILLQSPCLSGTCIIGYSNILFQPAKPLKEVRKGRVAKVVEVEEEQEVESPARSRRTGKNRSYSEFYDQ